MGYVFFDAHPDWPDRPFPSGTLVKYRCYDRVFVGLVVNAGFYSMIVWNLVERDTRFIFYSDIIDILTKERANNE